MKYTELDRKCGLEKFDKIDLLDLVARARNDLANGRTRSPNQLRGGSVGAIVNNQVHGVCHRKAYLRFNGIETPLRPEIELMTTQGEKNEDIWLDELKVALRTELEGTGLVVKDQTEFECAIEINGVPWSGSPDITIWKGDTPIQGAELKNISSVSKVKSAHYELRPHEDHIIQAANYSLRMGDIYLGGEPLPYKLIYSNRSIWQIFSMSEKVRKVILERGWDVDWKFGKPMSVLPFHREYLIDWDIDGRCRYWTAGMKDWVTTNLTRKSIDDYYDVVAKGMDKNNNLGPRPTTKHLDGKSAYSPCGYCDFSPVCAIGDRLSTNEFKDHATKLANDEWKTRENK